nr:MAG TPA: hypothetical protein [Caudoviricetes sp.]
MVVGGGGLSWATGHHCYVCVSVRQPPIGQVGDGLVSQGRKSVVDDSESIGVVLPESPGDDVVAHVESKRPPTVGCGSLEADGLAGLVDPVVRVAPGVGGGADGVGDVGVGGDVLCGGHCLVLSTPGWGLVLLPMSQSFSLVRHGSTPHGGDLSHKTMLCEALTGTGHVWYTRAHVPIYTEATSWWT